MSRKLDRKTTDFVNEMFANDFEAPRLGRGPGSDDYAELYRVWVAKLDRDFERYSADEVARAAEVLRRTRETRTFPMPGVILDALKKARKELDNEKPRTLTPRPRGPDYSARERLALDLIRCEMGRTAAREGWIGELFAFVRENGHLPRTQSEIKILIDGANVDDARGGARGTDERFRKCVTGEAGPLSGVLVRLGESMLARRKALAEFVLEGKPYTWGQP